MSEKKKKNKPFQTPAFSTPHPWRKRGEIEIKDIEKENQDVPKTNASERVGPFYRPKQLTPEEKVEKRRIRKIENARLQLMLKEKNYDRYTILIANILGMFSFGIAKFYLKFFQMWNAAVVEGVGILIYYTFLPLFLAMFNNPYLAITLTIPISFFTKFIMYRVWLFKRVESLKPLKTSPK